MPTSTTLSKTLVHSSGVKFCLFAMTAPKSSPHSSTRKEKSCTIAASVALALGFAGAKVARAAKPTDPQIAHIA
jgi:hypothetical protein